MKHLYYVRHGESDANVAALWSGSHDAVLTPHGIEQAKTAGKKAHDEGLTFDLIISSPLQRAHNTAKIIAEETGYPSDKIILDKNLQERFFGALEGTKHEKELIDAYWNNETVIDSTEDVETLEALHTRARNILASLKDRPEDTILIVSHGAFGRAMRRILEDLPPTTIVNAYPNAQVFKLI